jgi:hypothetical protein
MSGLRFIPGGIKLANQSADLHNPFRSASNKELVQIFAHKTPKIPDPFKEEVFYRDCSVSSDMLACLAKLLRSKCLIPFRNLAIVSLRKPFCLAFTG